MRSVAVVLFLALALAPVLWADAVCCPDEDDCRVACACLCCGNNAFHAAPPTPADESEGPESLGPFACALFVSHPVTPDFPPPRS